MTDPVLESLAAQFTDAADISSLQAFEQSLMSDVENHVTPASDFLDSLPTPFRSYFGSAYTAELSILSSDGFTDVAFTGTTASSTPTSTGSSSTTSSSSKNAAAPQGKYVGVSAGVLAGLLGFVMAL